MGDKTQLATVALATKYSNIIVAWFGTTTAMIIADAIGIIIGIVMGNEDPRAFSSNGSPPSSSCSRAIGPLSVPAENLLTPPAIAAGLALIVLSDRYGSPDEPRQGARAPRSERACTRTRVGRKEPILFVKAGTVFFLESPRNLDTLHTCV
jgi:hypothetical protein